MSSLQPLRKNHGRYHGETIQLDRVLREIEEVACQFGWSQQRFLDAPDVQLIALHRGSRVDRRRIYLSAGIHGDEPAGPLAVVELLKQNAWPEDVELWLFPCLNPTGFPLNTRTNASGCDLNRDYLQPTSREVRAHVELLKTLPAFDLAICLHEDWEAKGFYLYELNATGRSSFAESIIERVARVCPIDPSSQIDGRVARHGIIRPEIDPRLRPEWPEAFYLFQHQTRLSLTLEAPSDFVLGVRVKALIEATLAVLEWV